MRAMIYASQVAVLLLLVSTGCASGLLSTQSMMWNDGVAPWNKKQAREEEYLARTLRARTFEKNGQTEKAWAEYHLLTTDFPERAEPFHRLGVLADRRKIHGEAQGYYEKALALDPNNAEMLNDLGYSYFLAGNLARAEQMIQKALEKIPHNARFHNNLGLVYGQAGQFDKAFEELCKAGGVADAHYNMAYILASKGDVPGAKRALGMALQADPRHAKALQALRTFEKAERDPESIDEFEPYIDDGVEYVPFNERAMESSAAAAPAATMTNQLPVVGSAKTLNSRLSTLQSSMADI